MVTCMTAGLPSTRPVRFNGSYVLATTLRVRLQVCRLVRRKKGHSLIRPMVGAILAEWTSKLTRFGRKPSMLTRPMTFRPRVLMSVRYVLMDRFRDGPG